MASLGPDEDCPFLERDAKEADLRLIGNAQLRFEPPPAGHYVYSIDLHGPPYTNRR